MSISERYVSLMTTQVWEGTAVVGDYSLGARVLPLTASEMQTHHRKSLS